MEHRSLRLSFWLFAILAATAATAQASAINLNRATGCVRDCQLPKDNTLTGRGLTGYWRNAVGTSGQDLTSVAFELGKTYTYEVETSTEARTLFALSEEENMSEELIKVQATAWITPVSDCEMSLQLKNVRLHLKEQAKERLAGLEDVQQFTRQLEKPILFGYQAGVISEVCTDQAEESTVLNLKKSIISAFQTLPRLEDNQNVKVIESDYNGECETEYSVEKISSSRFTVHKEKNLAKCVNVAQQQMETSGNWKNALLKHNTAKVATCEQTIASRQMVSAECESVQTLNTVMPHFALELVSNVKITAMEVVDASEGMSAQIPSTWSRHAPRLMMSMPATTAMYGMMPKNNQKRASSGELVDGRVQLKSVLDQICDDIQTHGQRITTATASYVHTLADTLRASSQEDVVFVWKNIVQSGSICGAQAKKIQDIFVDTAASVMNRNAAAIVRDELLKYVERAQANQDQTALRRARYLATVVAFSFEPTPEAVREILPQLLEKIDDAQILLSLSALVKKTSIQMNDPHFVESLYETVLRKVTSRLSASYVPQQEADIVRLFGALQNIAPRSVVAGQERLVKISTDKRLPVPIRVAAIRSFTSIEMEHQLRQTLQAIFADRTEKNEVRLAAYRVMVYSRVTLEELNQIRKVIERSEENQDVHNYVCSHQKNLRTSDDAVKRSLLPLEAPVFPEPQSVSNVFLSRNYDYTYINPKTAIGAIVEADLVMEAESRIPRSVSFNVTVPVAEQQIPILEVTIRQEGLEATLAERLEAIKSIKSPAAIFRELSDLVRSQSRRNRNQAPYASNVEKSSKMQIFINADGKNVYLWDSMEASKEATTTEQFDTVLAQLYKRLPISIDETVVMMPLKHRVRLPTASGIPVNFELNTTLIASLESTIKGHQGVENLLEALIKPTFVVEFGVGLEAELPFSSYEAVHSQKSRVQFLNRFISQPTFNLKASFKPETREMNVKFLMPENEQIIGRFETIFNNDEEKEIVFSKLGEHSALKRQISDALKKREAVWYRAESRRSSGKDEQCVPVLDQLFGFTYCVQRYSASDLAGVLASRSAQKSIFVSEIKLVKTDRDMEGVEFGLRLPELFTPESSADELKFQFHFDTPASRVNRRVNTELVVRIPQSSTDKFLVRMEVDSPMKKFAAQAFFINTDVQKGLKIELITERDQRQFLLEVNAFLKVQEQLKQQIRLQLRLQPSPASPMTELEGEFNIAATSETKKKVSLKLSANAQEVLDFELIQSGSLSKPVDCKISATFKVAILGAQIESQALLNKNAATGTLKTTGEIKYNRFLAYSRRSRSAIETVSYAFQLSGLNQDSQSEQVKKFIHWTVQSSQFPQWNNELTYNIKGLISQFADFTQEFTFKWSANQEKRVHFVHELKSLQNVRSRNIKYQQAIELEITPLNFHHDVNMVFDFPQKDQATQNWAFELKCLNRRTSEVSAEARFATVIKQSPMQIETEGEIKLVNGKYIFTIADKAQEVRHNVIEGRMIVQLPEEFPQVYGFNWILPKKVSHKYSFTYTDAAVPRVPQGEEKESLQSRFADLINHLQRFESELTIDSESRGQIRRFFLFTINEQNDVQIKDQLDIEQRPLYKYEAEIIPRERSIKGKFESQYAQKLAFEFDAQMKKDVKRCELKFANRHFQHESRLIVDQQSQKYELTCQTKRDEEIVFELDAKKVNKDGRLVIKSPMMNAEVELENFQPRRVRSMLMKREVSRNERDNFRVKVAFKLPRYELEHQTEVKYTAVQRLMVLATETRKEERNLFKAQVHLQPEEKSFVAEYANGYTANVKLTANAQEEMYELVADYRIEPKQWFHKTAAKWQFSRRSSVHVGNYVMPAFRLISLEMKNHLGQKNVFDLTFRCNEANPSAEYAHQFIVSSLDTHAELSLSRFGFDWNNQAYQPKMLFVFQTKQFGGIQHKTELKEVNIEKRQMKLHSKTSRREEILAEVECELVLKRGEESRVKVQLPREYTMEATFVPFQWAEAHVAYGIWKHQARVDRQAATHQWNLKVESINQRKGDKWIGRLSHQCDKFTNVELDTPLVRGNAEIRLDSQSIRVDMKGAKQWAGLESKCEAQLDMDARKMTIKSVTLKQSRPYAVVDAELYASLSRTSTLKMELEPAQFKVNFQLDPKSACEMTVEAKEWKHAMNIKKRSAELTINMESRKDGAIVALFETELSPVKCTFKWEVGQWKRFSPMTLKGKFDLEDREMHLQAHHKASDRLAKFEAKMDKKNVHFEAAWDVNRHPAQKVLVQVRIQDQEIAPERFVASVRGDWIDRPYEVQIDLPRRLSDLSRASFNVEGEMKNRQTGEQYIAKYNRKIESGNGCATAIEVRRGDFTYVKVNIEAQYGEEAKKTVDLKVTSDYKVDALNVDFHLTRECAYKQCTTKATAVYGAEEKKEMSFEGANVADALRGNLAINTPRHHQQTIKFEFIKPESKLQINVFNQAGRQVDVNVDLARPLQKKFQIVSFIESIPTVDIESAHGENSRLVIQVSFQEEKKMELAINWFGQWRRDFKLEALFKCFSKPSLEMLITSRHPAGVDEIDAMFKIDAKEYIAKWSRTFDASKENWNTQSLLKVNGEKKIDLAVECQTKEMGNRQVKTFTVRLDGLHRAQGHVTVTLAAPNAWNRIEMVQCEFGNQQHQRQVAFELYLNAVDEQQSVHRTGVKLAAQDKTIFGLVALTNKRQSGELKRTSMIRMELPDEIEYVLRNEIEYEPYAREQIKSIRSELKKSQSNEEPIYQTRIVFAEEKETDMKVMRIEVRSARFAAPKMIQIRYNFAPKQCATFELVNQQRTFAYGHEAKCWRIELLAGKQLKNQEQQFENRNQNRNQNQQQQNESEPEYEIKIGAEYMKHAIDSRHFNRTVRFTLETVPQEETFQQPINFHMIGHLSTRSAGLKWENRNRHGEHKTGLMHFDVAPLDSKNNMLNVYLREQNKRNPEKDLTFEAHYAPKNAPVAQRFWMAGKWDQKRLRRWIVGELPQLQEMMHSNGNARMMRSRMIREIKEEIAHKMAYIKENYNNELVAPMMEEARQVQTQLRNSEDRIVAEVSKLSKRAVEKAEQVLESIEIEQTFVKMVDSVAQQLESIKRETAEEIARQCEKSTVCRQLVDQIRDYEIEQFIRVNVINRVEKMHRDLKRALPKELVETFQELAEQFKAAHDETYEQNNYNDEMEKEMPTNRQFARHGARLLMMAQPELTETFFKHSHKIAKHFDFDQENQKNQKQVNWAEVRGAVHDMAVDMIEQLQEKSQQNKTSKYEAQQPLSWTHFYGGAQGKEATDYSQYATKWNQYSPENQANTKTQEPKSNFLFSPKRGEFKLLDSTTQARQATWSRA